MSRALSTLPRLLRHAQGAAEDHVDHMFHLVARLGLGEKRGDGPVRMCRRLQRGRRSRDHALGSGTRPRRRIGLALANGRELGLRLRLTLRSSPARRAHVRRSWPSYAGESRDHRHAPARSISRDRRAADRAVPRECRHGRLARHLHVRLRRLRQRDVRHQPRGPLHRQDDGYAVRRARRRAERALGLRGRRVGARRMRELRADLVRRIRPRFGRAHERDRSRRPKLRPRRTTPSAA
jgi:hypothetical protein